MEYVKRVFIDFSAESMMAPWIYLCFNKEFTPGSGGQGGAATLGESMLNKSNLGKSMNSSKIGGYQGTSTNVNKSGVGALAADGVEASVFEEDLNLENEFGYLTDEDSVFHSFEQPEEAKPFPRPGKRMNLNKENRENSKEIKSVLKRYTEKSKTYEFLVKFEVRCDWEKAKRAKESTSLNEQGDKDSDGSIADAGKRNIPGAKELREHKEQDKKNLRDEARYFWDDKLLEDPTKVFEYANPFNPDMNERVLINYLMELVVKSASMLSLVGASGRPDESMKILEMSLNREDAMMEKSKLCIFKIGLMYVVLPFKVTKIEVRTRNVIINTRPSFEAISKFIGIYLTAYEEQDEKDREERSDWEEAQRLKAIEEAK